jgi:hypothetical protein
LKLKDHNKAVRRTRNVTWLKTSHTAKRQIGEVTGQEPGKREQRLGGEAPAEKW